MKESSDASIPSLFVAGKCIWKNCETEEWKMVDNTAFNEIHLDCNIRSHLTDGYYTALKASFKPLIIQLVLQVIQIKQVPKLSD